MSWKRIPLRHATVVLSRGTAPDYCEDGPVRMISQAANQDAGIDWNRTRFHAHDGDLRKLKGLLQSGDSLVNSTGTGTLGRVGWFSCGPDSRPCVADGHVTLVRFDPEKVHARFGHYFLNSDLFQNLMFETLVFGSTNQIELSRERMLGVPIPVPNVIDQRAMADFLDVETARIDALIAKKRRIVELLDTRFWTAVEDMALSNMRHAPLRRALLSITDGPFGSAFSSSDYVSKGPAVVRLGNIGFAEYRSSDQARVSVGLYDRFLRHAVFPGDLLIAALGDDSNHAGRACVFPAGLGPAMVKGKCFCARVDPSRAQAEYLALVLSTPYAARLIGQATRGSTRSMINLEIIKTVAVPLPSIDTQRQIVEESDRLRVGGQDVRDRLDRQISLLRERKQALITAAVTGEMEVPGVSR